MQTGIPYMQFRGGSSKGLFFKATDLPADEASRNKIILATMEGVGQGDLRQIDGLGGGTSLTSKVAIVSLSKEKDADIDYLFLQVVIGKGKIATMQTCGNILAGVVPFAVELAILAQVIAFKLDARDHETLTFNHIDGDGDVFLVG